MPYREPIFFKGGCYHVYSRGSEKRLIFLDRTDRERFLERFKEYKDRHNVSIICYCLMPNHYHLLIKQNTDEPISKFMNRLNLAYAMYFNKRYERVGPLFQGRFKAKLIETDEYIVQLSKYIHLNPLGIIGNLDVENYPWSSLRYYLNDQTDDFLDKNQILSYFGENYASKKYIELVRAEAGQKLKQKIQNLILEEPDPAQVRVLSGGKLGE